MHHNMNYPLLICDMSKPALLAYAKMKIQLSCTFLLTDQYFLAAKIKNDYLVSDAAQDSLSFFIPINPKTGFFCNRAYIKVPPFSMSNLTISG